MFNDDIYVHFSPAISFSKHGGPIRKKLKNKPFVSVAIFKN